VNTSTDVLDLIRRWAAAEAANDSGGIDALLADDFMGVGPFGFVLTRDQWLVRFENGLVNSAFAVEDPSVRELGDAAVVVGALDQQNSFGGQDNADRFRLTLVAVKHAGGWALAHVHIGPLQAPPGTPGAS
jgi:ketosteroid isomerase-like protein